MSQSFVTFYPETSDKSFANTETSRSIQFLDIDSLEPKHLNQDYFTLIKKLSYAYAVAPNSEDREFEKLPILISNNPDSTVPISAADAIGHPIYYFQNECIYLINPKSCEIAGSRFTDLTQYFLNKKIKYCNNFELTTFDEQCFFLSHAVKNERYHPDDTVEGFIKKQSRGYSSDAIVLTNDKEKTKLRALHPDNFVENLHSDFCFCIKNSEPEDNVQELLDEFCYLDNSDPNDAKYVLLAGTLEIAENLDLSKEEDFLLFVKTLSSRFRRKVQKIKILTNAYKVRQAIQKAAEEEIAEASELEETAA